ncbi:MAG: hypothetical protein ACI9R3_005041 [Verrucomicrobiales bacterium]|jgi:hypothetical protein
MFLESDIARLSLERLKDWTGVMSPEPALCFNSGLLSFSTFPLSIFSRHPQRSIPTKCTAFLRKNPGMRIWTATFHLETLPPVVQSAIAHLFDFFDFRNALDTLTSG